MHPYQDAGRPVDERVEDLLSRMTPEEKAGQLFHTILTMNPDGTPVTEPDDPPSRFTTRELIAGRHPELVLRFADTVRREYLSVGFRTALHPQIDLATEPRWSRQSGTFGSDAQLTGELVEAYVRGLQGETLGPDSVAAMVKRFPGGGPQKDGEDPHFPHGKEQVYPGGMREHHLEPFRAAVAAGCSQMMPYYGQPIGTDWEEVGFGFNKGVVTGLLREELGFGGIVCTDWGLLTDSVIFGEPHEARAWGVEHLSTAERAAKALDAGVDQFGGEQCPEVIVELMTSGRIPESRVDASVRRLLREKFLLGLFDHRRYVDPDEAAETVGHADFTAAHAAALLADYGASDDALLDVLFGRARPEGRLPFELPRSMEAVRAARPDVPNDTEDPVFPHGYGLEL